MTSSPPPGINRSTIRCAEDEFGTSTWQAWLDAQDARAAAAGQPSRPRPLGEAPDAPSVTAVLNYGRWLARCDCSAAVLLFRGEAGRWFWCPACGNAATGGKLRPVTWPSDRAAIETNMASLPTALANWDPVEDARRDAVIAAQRASAGREAGGA